MLSIVRHQLAAVVVAGWVFSGLAWGQGGLGNDHCHTPVRPQAGFSGQAAGRFAHKNLLVLHEGYYFIVQVRLDRTTQQSSVVAIQPVNGTGRLTPADQAQLGSIQVLRINPGSTAEIVAAANSAPVPAPAPLATANPNVNTVANVPTAGTPVPPAPVGGATPAISGNALNAAVPQVAAGQTAPVGNPVPSQPLPAASTASLNSVAQTLTPAPAPATQPASNASIPGAVNPPQLVPQNVAAGLIRAFAAQTTASQTAAPTAISQTPAVVPPATLPATGDNTPATAPAPSPAATTPAAAPAIEQTAAQSIDENKFPSDLPPAF